MENKNDRIKGIIAALLFLLLLFVISVFLGFYYPEPPVPDEGIEIEMGGSGSSGGMQGMESVAEPEPVTKSAPSPISQTYVTENNPETPYTPVTTPTVKPKEVSEVAQPEPPKKKVNPDAQYTKKGTSSQQGGGSSTGTGIGTGTGNKPGDGTGPGTGAGSGASFSLVGRTAKVLPKPSYNSDSQGKVVIEVNVDQEGNVVDAQYNSKLSTTTDLQLRTAALEAARKSKFSVKLDASVVQRGTITYTFIKLN